LSIRTLGAVPSGQATGRKLTGNKLAGVCFNCRIGPVIFILALYAFFSRCPAIPGGGDALERNSQ